MLALFPPVEVDSLLSKVVDTEDHILGRECNRLSVCRVKEVCGAEHECPALKLCRLAERNMYSHLVTVEVGVECVTYERMELKCLTVDKDRLECLEAQSMERRRTVEHDGMLFNDILENRPYFRCSFFNHHLSFLDVWCNTVVMKLPDQERLKEFECHE